MQIYQSEQISAQNTYSNPDNQFDFVSSEYVSLNNTNIDLKLLRDNLAKEFFDLISQIKENNKNGVPKIAIVSDPSLIGPIGQVVNMKILRESGLLYSLKSDPVDILADHIIYFVRPEEKLVRIITKHIKIYNLYEECKSFYVYFVSRKNVLCENIFKEEGVWQYIKVGEYNLDLIPTDNDILTMELPLSFDQFTEDNKSSLFDVAALDLKD